MAEGGRIDIILGANASELKAELADTDRRLRQTGAASEETAERMSAAFLKAGAATVAALGAAGAAIGAMTVAALQRVDDLAKLGRSAGLTAEEISGLAYAADLSGVAAQELGVDLGVLNRRMSDAATGGGNAGKIFAALGVSVTDASGRMRPTVGVLEEVADRFRELPDGALKSATAIELFGRGGAPFINFLNEGSEGLRALRAEAAAAGVVFDEELGAAAEHLNDDFSRIQAQIEGTKLAIAASLLPAVQGITTATLGWAVANRGAIAADVTKWINRVTTAAREAAPVLSFIADSVSVIGEGIGGASRLAGALSANPDRQGATGNATLDLVNDLRDAWAALRGETENQDFQRVIDEALSPLQDDLPKKDLAIKPADILPDSTITEVSERQKKLVAALQAALAETPEKAKDTERAAARVTDEFERMPAAVEGATASVENLAQTTRTFGQIAGDIGTDIITGIALGTGRLEDAGRRAGQAFVGEFIRTTLEGAVKSDFTQNLVATIPGINRLFGATGAASPVVTGANFTSASNQSIIEGIGVTGVLGGGGQGASQVGVGGSTGAGAAAGGGAAAAGYAALIYAGVQGAIAAANVDFSLYRSEKDRLQASQQAFGEGFLGAFGVDGKLGKGLAKIIGGTTLARGRLPKSAGDFFSDPRYVLDPHTTIALLAGVFQPETSERYALNPILDIGKKIRPRGFPDVTKETPYEDAGKLFLRFPTQAAREQFGQDIGIPVPKDFGGNLADLTTYAPGGKRGDVGAVVPQFPGIENFLDNDATARKIRAGAGFGLGSVLSGDIDWFGTSTGQGNAIANIVDEANVSMEEGTRIARQFARAAGLDATSSWDELNRKTREGIIKTIPELSAAVQGNLDLWYDLPPGVNKADIALSAISETAGGKLVIDVSKLNKETERAIEIFGRLEDATKGGLKGAIFESFTAAAAGEDPTKAFSISLAQSIRGNITTAIVEGASDAITKLPSFEDLQLGIAATAQGQPADLTALFATFGQQALPVLEEWARVAEDFAGTVTVLPTELRKSAESWRETADDLRLQGLSPSRQRRVLEADVKGIDAEIAGLRADDIDDSKQATKFAELLNKKGGLLVDLAGSTSSRSRKNRYLSQIDANAADIDALALDQEAYLSTLGSGTATTSTGVPSTATAPAATSTVPQAVPGPASGVPATNAGASSAPTPVGFDATQWMHEIAGNTAALGLNTTALTALTTSFESMEFPDFRNDDWEPPTVPRRRKDDPESLPAIAGEMMGFFREQRGELTTALRFLAGALSGIL